MNEANPETHKTVDIGKLHAASTHSQQGTSLENTVSSKNLFL